jgi:hypothetical protein
MKYLEELIPGSFFSHNNEKFLLTSDFRLNKNQKRFNCINIINGSSRWVDDNTTVEVIYLYYQDEDKNLVLLKEYEHNEDFEKNKNIH